MAKHKDSFEFLMEKVFSDEEQWLLDTQFSKPFMEQLNPGRIELLEHFNAFVEQLESAKNFEQADSCLDKFYCNLASIQELEIRMPLKVVNATSCITKFNSIVNRLGVFPEGTTVTGKFGGLDVDSWFDVPENFYENTTDSVDFLKPMGLNLVLEEAEISHNNVVLNFPGITIIPLNHGNPELYKLNY